MKDILEKITSLLLTHDVDEDVCKKLKCNDGYKDTYDCLECVINFYNKPCKWERDGVCVNDDSEWCADFIDNIKCGSCRYYE